MDIYIYYIPHEAHPGIVDDRERRRKGSSSSSNIRSSRRGNLIGRRSKLYTCAHTRTHTYTHTHTYAHSRSSTLQSASSIVYIVSPSLFMAVRGCGRHGYEAAAQWYYYTPSARGYRRSVARRRDARPPIVQRYGVRVARRHKKNSASRFLYSARKQRRPRPAALKTGSSPGRRQRHRRRRRRRTLARRPSAARIDPRALAASIASGDRAHSVPLS